MVNDTYGTQILYEAPSEDQTHYSVVITKWNEIANQYTIMRCLNV